MQKLLTVEFGNNPIKTYSNRAVLSLGDSTATVPWKTSNFRCPWELIPEKVVKGCNFFFTINPDPHVDWYTHDSDKKTIIPKFLLLLQELKDKGIIINSVSVYEYGKFGKRHGKLHFHGIIKTKRRQEFEAEVLKVFNKRSNLRHCTVDTKTIKSVADRNRILNYMHTSKTKKGKIYSAEQQNKIKCLYYN